MSQGTKKKRWPSLQIAFTCAVVVTTATSILSGCVNIKSVEVPLPHATSGEAAKTLRYVKTIDTINLGSNDAIKQLIAGQDTHNLVRPIAVSLHNNTMMIVDGGRVYEKRGMAVPEPDYGVYDAFTRVEDEAFNTVFVYDLNTGGMRLIRGIGEQVKGEISDIYLASDLSFYITDVDGRRVLHFSPSGKLLNIYRHPPNIFRPIAVTVDEKRNEVLIADETYSHIVSFKMNKTEPTYGMGARGNGPGKFRIITDMIAIPDGFLVSDRIELRVQVLDRAGNFVAEFGKGIITFPTALAVDAEGRVFVSDKADSTIKVFKAGKLIDTIGRNGYGAGEFRYISDMKVLGNQLYVVDSLNGRIQVFEFIPDAKRLALLN